ncbi:hypothetical protein MKX03_029381 [Papaver bracteatum]|nr:hypothetical protein MKX03_029381 [Papaver bracteatum]
MKRRNNLEDLLMLELRNGCRFDGSEIEELMIEIGNFCVSCNGIQERFQSLGVAFYGGADCCVLLYNANVHKSFDNLNHWREELLKQASPANPEKFRFILLGNKVDIDGGNNRVVSEKKAKLWSSCRGDIPYFETSSKEDQNVDVAFQLLERLHIPMNNRMICKDFNPIPDEVPIDQRGGGGCAC